MKKLSEEELKFYNYTDDQIQAIKTYDGSEEKSIRASATVSISISKKQLSYNSSNGLSTVGATMSFSWVGSPSDYGKDSVGIAFEADNNHNFKAITNVSSSLNYKEWKSASNVKTWTKSATNKGDQGITGSYGWQFPLKTMGDIYYAFLYSGTFTAYGTVSGKLSYFNFRYIYTHKTLGLGADMGFSVSTNGTSAGINLSVKTYYTAFPKSTGGIVTFS